MALTKNETEEAILKQLSQQFSRAVAEERKNRWIVIDLATMIYRRFGYTGLQYACQGTTVDVRQLMVYAEIGDAFPATTRAPYQDLPYTYFRTALRIAKRQTNDPAKDALYWIRLAAEKGWSAAQMDREAQTLQTPAASASPDDLVTVAQRRVVQGLQEQGGLLAKVAWHNAVFAPFTGKVLQVVLVDYVPVAAV